MTMPGRLGLVLLALLSLTGTAFAAGSAGDPRDPQKHYNAPDQSWARSMRRSETYAAGVIP